MSVTHNRIRTETKEDGTSPCEHTGQVVSLIDALNKSVVFSSKITVTDYQSEPEEGAAWIRVQTNGFGWELHLDGEHDQWFVSRILGEENENVGEEDDLLEEINTLGYPDLDRAIWCFVGDIPKRMLEAKINTSSE